MNGLRLLTGISGAALLSALLASEARAQAELPTIEVGAAAKRRAAKVAPAPKPQKVTVRPVAPRPPPAPAPQSAVQQAEQKFNATQETASSKFTTGAEINAVPFSRTGEALETAVPGLLVTQHSGEGKANQYQMRGFQLDHGTDFAVNLDGMPLNMPTHGHGQGYADANFLIPELFSYVVAHKGPYFAEEGDFSAAGAVHIQYKDEIPGGLFVATGGSFDYGRLLAIESTKVNGGNLLQAIELGIYNGPWTVPDEVHRINGVMRWTTGTPENGLAIDAMAYANRWHASNQIPERAVTEGVISLYGNIEPADRGDTTRFSLSTQWNETNAHDYSKVEAFAMHTTLDLYNDFDYFLAQPLLGDQFRQFDRRTILGLRAEHGWDYTYAGFPVETRVGVQSRYDDIRVGIQDTVDKMAFQTLTNDGVDEGNVGVWTDTTVHWTPWLRTTTGIRGDYFAASVGDYQNPLESPFISSAPGVPLGIPSFLYNPATLAPYPLAANPAVAWIWTGPWNSGSKNAAFDSPKASIVLGPWNKTEFFFNFGEGYHSVDARATVTNLNPSDGSEAAKPPLLVKARGAEIGARTKFLEGLDSTFTLWWLNFDSESQFDGDTGTTLFGRPSRRYGIEWTNHYSPYSWLHFDGDLALSHARSRGWDVPQTVTYASLVTPATYPYFQFPGNAPGNYIPEGPPIVASIAVEIGDKTGWYFGGKFRFKGSYPVTEDGTIRAPSSGWLDLRGGYRWDNGLKLNIDLFNVLNSKSDQITYGYGSMLPTDPLYAPCLAGTAPTAVCSNGQQDRHFKPMEPIAVRATLSGPLNLHTFDPLLEPGKMKSPLELLDLAYAEEEQRRLVTKGPLAPPARWTGFYAGLNAGVGFGADNSVHYANTPGGPGFDPGLAFLGNGVFGDSNAAFVGGGQIGYNYHFAQRTVVGLEADVQGLAGGSGTSVAPSAGSSFAVAGGTLLGSLTASEKVDYFGTARGRLGYLFTPRTLLFATGGLAWGHAAFDTASQLITVSPAGAIVSLAGGQSSYADTKVGWTVGAGFEWMFAPNWSFKGEYLYYDLGSFNVSTPATTIAVPGGAVSSSWATSYHARSDGQIVRAGLNYHFDFGGETPIVAKY